MDEIMKSLLTIRRLQQLSDITEIPDEILDPEPERDNRLGNSAGGPSQARVLDSHNPYQSPSPGRPPPTSLNNHSLRSARHNLLDSLLPFSHPAMDSNPSASAPASLRAERSDVQTPSPTAGRSCNVSITRSSSATDIPLTTPAILPPSITSSPVHPRSASSSVVGNPTESRSREVDRPAGLVPPVQTGTMNLKLLTCHWWFSAGSCRFSAQDCLYSHYDTGHRAEAPRSVIPGQPAVAGRNAHRRLHQASLQNQLTNLNLNDARNMAPNANNRGRSSNSSLADGTNIFNAGSQSSTPGIMIHGPNGHTMHMAPPMIPMANIIPNSALHFATTNAAQLENEVQFFRTLVEQGGNEKEVMVTTIQNLQAENQSLRTSSTSLTSENARLVEERDALRGALALLQNSTNSPLSRSSTPIGNSSLRRAMPGSASWADFGAIGGKRHAS